jgi:diguanylate cyclase (GGDEF)-like protein
VPINSQAAERPASGAAEWQPELIERARGEFAVAREIARARRERRQLSVVLFDLSSPREQGAGVLESGELTDVTDTFVHVVRPSDLPIRWSGNELLLVLPGLAGRDARAVAERVRAAMQARGGRRVAVSGGVAEVELNEQFGNVVDRARERVMQALKHGHNRVG